MELDDENERCRVTLTGKTLVPKESHQDGRPRPYFSNSEKSISIACNIEQ